MIDIRDPRTYIEHFLKIRTKSGEVITLKLNPAQERLYGIIDEKRRAGKPVRLIILKARQMGFSTLIEALMFHASATAFNVESIVVAHTDESTAQLFRMAKRYYEDLPPLLKPMRRASNAQELLFDAPAKSDKNGLKSRVRCATAGGSGIGRGFTFTNAHLSEFAFWPGDKMATYIGLAQAVPYLPGTMIAIESTANGYNEFKTMWDAAVEAERAGDETGFTPVFFPWFEMPDYTAEVPSGLVLTDEERELKERFRLTDGQLVWRRRTIKNECGGDINLFRQEYPATPDEAFIATGQSVFEKDVLVNRRHEVEKDAWERGHFDVSFAGDGSISGFLWQRDERGPVRIRRHPENNVPYVIGGDTAGTGSDDFVGQVLDNRTGEQIAVLQHKFGEREYAIQMYALGRYYNDALIGIETNYSTYPEKKLEEFNYPNLYVRQRTDTYTGKLMETYGFETNTKTRPLIIDGLKDVAAHTPENLTDFETLGQMLTFVYDDNWKPQAQLGEHDDLVMALAIAHYIRPQQRYTVKLPGKERVEWRKDQWEDYRRASPAERKMLREKWGEPK